MKKRIIILVIAALALGGVLIFAPKLRLASVKDDAALRAIPQGNVGLVVRINSWTTVREQVEASSGIWLSLLDSAASSWLWHVSGLMDSLVRTESALGLALSHGEFYLSYHAVKRATWTLEPLISLRAKDMHLSQEKVGTLLLPGIQAQREKGSVDMLRYAWAHGGSRGEIFVGERAGVILLSPFHLLLEEAIKAPHGTTTLAESPAFRSVLEASSSSEPANAYVYLPNVLKVLKGAFRAPWQEAIARLGDSQAPWCGWMSLDLNANSRAISTNGLSNFSDSLQMQSNGWKGVQGAPIRIVEGLPASCTFFIRWGGRRVKDLHRVLGRSSDADSSLMSILESSELARAYLPRREEWVCALHSKELDETIQRLRPRSKPVPKQAFECYEFAEPDILHRLTPVIGKEDARYYARKGEFLYFSRDLDLLRSLIVEVNYGRTIAQSPRWEELNREMQTDCNLLIYSDLGQATSWIHELASPQAEKNLLLPERSLEHLHGGVIQVTGARGIIFYSGFVSQGNTKGPVTTNEAPGAMAWEFPLEAEIAQGPWVRRTHRKEGRIILVQDVHNTLYMLTPQGQLKWKVQLNGPIHEQVHEVDLLNNSKIQYAFCTDHEIMALDYNGHRVSRRAAVQVPTKITSPLSIFTYPDQPKSERERFVVVCEDGRVRMYSRSGQEVDFKSPALTPGSAWAPIWLQHQGKDHILVRDDSQLHILKRNGDPRWDTHSLPSLAAHSELGIDCARAGDLSTAQHILYATGDGKLCRVDLAKQEAQTIEIAPFERAIHVAFANSGSKTLVLCLTRSSVHAFDQTGRALWEYELECDETSRLQAMENPLRLAILVESRGELTLLDTQGKLVEGFPRPATSNVATGWASPTSITMGMPPNLLVGYER